MIKNIIFDFNGTIIDDLDVSVDALNVCIDKYIENGHHVSKEEYLETFGFPVGPFYEALGFDWNKVDYRELSNFFIAYYESRAYKECKLFENIEVLLANLKKEGYKLYILSASFIDLLKDQLKHYGIYDYFDGLIAQANKFALSKVEIGRVYFKEHNINPNECLMIGDTLHDYEVAKELGMSKIISYSKGHNSKERLKKCNEFTIDSYDELYKYLK